MRGIILAGGSGSRLYPLTKVVSKQLIAVYDKPLVYYPLTTLMEGGIREICLISGPESLESYRALLGDGSQFGISIEYRVQEKPQGIAQAFLIAESFIGDEDVALILGDNIFHGPALLSEQALEYIDDKQVIFACAVKNPGSYGVIEMDDDDNIISIEEKPENPKGNYAIPGLYVFECDAPKIARMLDPSPRGELEIVGIIEQYFNQGRLMVHRLPRGFVWLDAGTSTSLHQASAYVQTIEQRTGVKIGCPEEAALRMEFISKEQFKELIQKMPSCEYRDYLEKIE